MTLPWFLASDVCACLNPGSVIGRARSYIQGGRFVSHERRLSPSLPSRGEGSVTQVRVLTLV
jgi:hypothetical protein